MIGIAGTETARRVHVLLGVCRVGSVALQSGRIALAVQVGNALKGAAADWELMKKVAQAEEMAERLRTLSWLSGEVFGDDPAASVATYADWYLSIQAAFSQMSRETDAAPA